MMRKKPMQNNNYGRQKHRHQGRHSGHGGHGGQRKNYGASREKYLAQARDALSSGDRVMAEYYYQHAEHCFRMLAEENGGRPPRHFQQQPQGDEQPHNPQEGPGNADTYQEPSNTGALPAFITAGQSPNTPPAVVPDSED